MSAALAAPAKNAARADLSPAIPAFEQQLFFKSFDDEEIGMRVRRIERQIFGEAVDAPLPERITRLESLYQERQAELKKAADDQAQAQARAQEQAQAAAAAAQSKVRAQQGQQNKVSAEERMRLEAQAAREKEIADLLQEGVDLFRGRQLQPAIDKFGQVLRLDPQNPDAHFSIGIALEAQGNFVEAYNNYQMAAQFNPANQDYRDAIKAVEKKADTQKRTVGQQKEQKQLAEQAAAAFKRGEYISALQLYQQLDAETPNRALIKYNLATIYLMMKDQSTALKFYEDAYRLEGSNPRYAKAYKELAAELKRAGKQQARVDKETQKEWADATGDGKKKNKERKERKQKDNIGSGSGRPGMVMMPAGGQPAYAQGQDPLSMLGFAGRFSGDGFVVGRILSGSRAAAAGLAPGDNIKAIDGFEFFNDAEMQQILRQKMGGSVQMMIMRGGQLAVINL